MGITPKGLKTVWILTAMCIVALMSILSGVIISSHMSGANLAKNALNLVGKSKQEVQAQIGKPFHIYSMAEFETSESPNDGRRKSQMPAIEYDEVHQYAQGAFFLFIYYKNDRVINFYGYDS